MRFFLLFLMLIFSYKYALADTTVSAKFVGSGIGLGGLLAVLASWSRNQSILWAIFHFFLGWIYVIYFVITRKS